MALAAPFTQLEPDTQEYQDLSSLAEADLLAVDELPAEGLSRLEAAVMLQGALRSYGDTPSADSAAALELEASFNRLLHSLAEELAMIGTHVDAVTSSAEASDESPGQPPSACCPVEEEDPCPEKLPELSMSGFFQLQSRLDRSHYTDGSTEDSGSTDVYWGELGWDASFDDWSGHFSLALLDDASDVVMYEAWARYDDPESPFYLVMGQQALPFAYNDSYFPSYSASYDLGFTVTDGLRAGWEADSWGLQATLFNPESQIEGQDDTFSDYSLVWDISRSEAAECSAGWLLRAGYTSNLGESDLELVGPLAQRRVAGLNLYGRYDWPDQRWHLLADYVSALDDFSPADLDANGDGMGDRPAALNLELVFEPQPADMWGLNYQSSSELADYAANRYGVLYGRRLNSLATLKLEYSHGTFDGFSSEELQSEDSLVVEVMLEF